MKDLLSSIFDIQSSTQFETLALRIFQYQSKENPVYKEYVHSLGIDASAINKTNQIPFLPIEFFKTHKVICGNKKTELTFLSSGTTGTARSKHHLTSISIYKQSIKKGFEHFYGNIEDYCILAVLPNRERDNTSSLGFMLNDWIKRSKHKESAFYTPQKKELYSKLQLLMAAKQKTILIGVSHALLDVISNKEMNMVNSFTHLIVMETGGMKGKREELTREDLHKALSEQIGLSTIHSEYGMTELLSQAYSKGKGIFYCPPFMKILTRDTYDPFHFLGTNITGAINIIDFANVYSCSFIATQDLGKVYKNGSFEILGRWDNSDLRGCNLIG